MNTEQRKKNSEWNLRDLHQSNGLIFIAQLHDGRDSQTFIRWISGIGFNLFTSASTVSQKLKAMLSSPDTCGRSGLV